MGHDLAHLHYGHGAATKARKDTSEGLSTILGTMLNIAGVPMGDTLVNVGAQAITSAYSQDQEREADIKGLEWSMKAGFTACGGVVAMRALQQSAGFDIPFLATHPGHEERIQRASKVAGRDC